MMKARDRCIITILNDCAASQHLFGSIDNADVAYVTMGVDTGVKGEASCCGMRLVHLLLGWPTY